MKAFPCLELLTVWQFGQMDPSKGRLSGLHESLAVQRGDLVVGDDKGIVARVAGDEALRQGNQTSSDPDLVPPVPEFNVDLLFDGLML